MSKKAGRISYLICQSSKTCGEETNNKGERNKPLGNNNNARLEYPSICIYDVSLFSGRQKTQKKKKKSYFISLCDGLLLIHSCVKKSVIIISFLREGGCCVHPLENYVIHFSTKGKKRREET